MRRKYRVFPGEYRGLLRKGWVMSTAKGLGMAENREAEAVVLMEGARNLVSVMPGGVSEEGKRLLRALAEGKALPEAMQVALAPAEGVRVRDVE